MEHGGGGDEHAHVDRTGGAHRHHNVGELEAEDVPLRFLGRADDAMLRERRMEIDHVRHDRRADDPDRQ